MQAEKVETFTSEFKRKQIKMRHGCHKRKSISPSPNDGRICKFASRRRYGHFYHRGEESSFDSDVNEQFHHRHHHHNHEVQHHHHNHHRRGPHHRRQHHGHGHHHDHEHGHGQEHHHGPRFGFLRRFHRKSPSCEHREQSTSSRCHQQRDQGLHQRSIPSFFGIRRRHSFGGICRRSKSPNKTINIE
jgi:hypothetical protein